MILVFGGTTEGRRAIRALEEAGSLYWYSTKTGEQDVAMHHGRRTVGAMDKEAMEAFCGEHGIRLIVDAAHPFASILHQTIAEVACSLQIPVVRFERIYPPRDPDITWIDDYKEMPTDVHTLLATTGVQSIKRLKYLEESGITVFYRILDRDSSVRLALTQGARPEQLCYYEEAGEIPVEADAILLKESGTSGGFVEKVAAAKAKGMRVIALRRPEMPKGFHTVDGEYGLRRMVERLLPEFYPLKSGLTTGTCATAAAVAAAVRLLHGETPSEVPVRLPNGETIMVPVRYGEDYACCIKESGDDPDVTNGIEVRAQASITPQVGTQRVASDTQPKPIVATGSAPTLFEECEIGRDTSRPYILRIYAGEGIGRFTLPGFDFPPGEPAVNRVPREMLRENLANMLQQVHYEPPSLFKGESEGVRIVLSVPNGEEIARRTFNPRLGIEGGISIIGVSGIVMPYSEEAFLQSIRKCMEVARASKSERVVIGSGMKSEQQLRNLYPDLPHQAFVEYGNYIGETLKMADELGFQYVTLGIMIGKAVKLAQGHLDTHSRRVTMDKAFIQQMLDEANCHNVKLSNCQFTVARELWDILSPEEADRFAEVVVRHCYAHCKPLLPKTELKIVLVRKEE